MTSFIKTQLKDGRELTSTCFIISSGDRGALIFTPSDRATRNFIAKARDDALKLFGDLPIILVPRDRDQQTTQRKKPGAFAPGS